MVQGVKVEDPAVVAELLEASGRDHVPSYETLSCFPIRMLPLLKELMDEQRPDAR